MKLEKQLLYSWIIAALTVGAFASGREACGYECRHYIYILRGA